MVKSIILVTNIVSFPIFNGVRNLYVYNFLLPSTKILKQLIYLKYWIEIMNMLITNCILERFNSRFTNLQNRKPKLRKNLDISNLTKFPVHSYIGWQTFHFSKWRSTSRHTLGNSMTIRCLKNTVLINQNADIFHKVLEKTFSLYFSL